MSRTKIYKDVTDQVIKGLKVGLIPWKKAWTEETLPKNFKSGRTYIGVNLWVLLAAPFDSNLWLTFNQVKELGGSIKKGEKGTKICYWNVARKEVENGENGELTEKKIFYLKTYTVFNSEQIQGIEFPSIHNTTGGVTFESAEQLISKYEGGPSVSHSNRADGAYYVPAEDKIMLPQKASFKNTSGYYSTLFHELAHSTGHAKRLNREGVTNYDRFGSEQYSMEELIAEMSACFMLSMCGLSENITTNNQAYINGWIEKLQSDPKVLFQASKEAQKACEFILGAEAHVHDKPQAA